LATAPAAGDVIDDFWRAGGRTAFPGDDGDVAMQDETAVFS
jgi:hypothetical protein